MKVAAEYLPIACTGRDQITDVRLYGMFFFQLYRVDERRGVESGHSSRSFGGGSFSFLYICKKKKFPVVAMHVFMSLSNLLTISVGSVY